jgi:hypothetical protein
MIYPRIVSMFAVVTSLGLSDVVPGWLPAERLG